MISKQDVEITANHGEVRMSLSHVVKKTKLFSNAINVSVSSSFEF